MKVILICSFHIILKNYSSLDIDSKETLISDFYHTAIHRHLKVLGIFARLYYRDNKKIFD